MSLLPNAVRQQSTIGSIIAGIGIGASVAGSIFFVAKEYGPRWVVIIVLNAAQDANDAPPEISPDAIEWIPFQPLYVLLSSVFSAACASTCALAVSLALVFYYRQKHKTQVESLQQQAYRVLDLLIHAKRLASLSFLGEKSSPKKQHQSANRLCEDFSESCAHLVAEFKTLHAKPAHDSYVKRIMSGALQELGQCEKVIQRLHDALSDDSDQKHIQKILKELGTDIAGIAIHLEHYRDQLKPPSPLL